jgi:glutathione peroxidase
MLGSLSGLRSPLLSCLLLGLAAITGVSAQTAAANSNASCPGLLNKTFKRLQDESPQDLCQYAGKVLLVVNTASYCGFTYQYEGLEKLHTDLSGKGLVVLGFPSNDFGQLEPGNGKQIAEFCTNTFGVKFPMFEKSIVAGSNANPLYRELSQITGKPPLWNFHKYLVDRKGRVLGSYPSAVVPQDKHLMADIDKALAGN